MSDEELKDLKTRAETLFSKAYNERELAKNSFENGCHKEGNTHLFQAGSYTSQAEALMLEYKKLGGV